MERSDLSPLYRTDAKPSAEAACRLCRGAKEEDRRSKGVWGIGNTLFAKSKLRSPKAPQFLLVNQVIAFASETRKDCAVAVAALGYNFENFNLRSRIAQNCLLHNASKILSLNYSVNYSILLMYEQPSQFPAPASAQVPP